MSTQCVIDLEASLQCELDGQPISLQARQGVIIINVESTKVARAILGSLRRFGTVRAVIARLSAALRDSSQRLELHVNDVLVAAMGAETNSGFLRLAGMRNVQLWPFRFLRI